MRTPIRTRLALLALVVPLATGAGWPEGGLPDVIVVENASTAETGFAAEGIETWGRTAYAGSLANGSIVKADLVTGEVTTLVESGPGMAVGLGIHPGGKLLFVAGGTIGDLRVYDTRTGELAGRFEVGGQMVNDVDVTAHAAYFTDAFRNVVYVLPIGPEGAFGEPKVVPLTGDYTPSVGFNANGIVATRGTLIVAQSAAPEGSGSALYKVDPATGVAERITLDEPIANADGLVIIGRTLYVVDNAGNQVDKIRLDPDLTSGTVVDVITDPNFNIPTTASIALGGLYVVNGQFGDAEDRTWEIVRIDKHRD